MDPQSPPAAPGAPPAAPPAPGAPPSLPVSETFPREYVEKLRQEAADSRIKLKHFEDAQAAAEQARLSAAGEHEKAAQAALAQVKKLEAELAARDLRERRRTAAVKHGIEPFADRLQGTTEEEIEADAKAFAAALPKPAPPPAAPPAPPPALPFPTNPARPAPGSGGPAFTVANPPSWNEAFRATGPKP